MVGILDESLIFGYECRHDGVVGLIERGIDVVVAFPYGIDRLMNGELQGMPIHEMAVTHARHDVERTVDGERYNRQLEFVGQSKGTTTEASHVAGEGASALGEYGQTDAILEGVACSIV